MRTSTPFYVVRKIEHGLLGNDSTFAVGKRRLRNIHGRQDFSTGPLTALPQRKRLLDHFPFVMKGAPPE